MSHVIHYQPRIWNLKFGKCIFFDKINGHLPGGRGTDRHQKTRFQDAIEDRYRGIDKFFRLKKVRAG